jgi:hypothetical protein
MSGFEAHLKRNHREKPSALRTVTLVCLVLLALLAVAQVAHTHAVESDADHCPLCILMHTAAPAAVAATVVVLVQLESRAPIYEAHTVTRHWNPKLFTRPPPACS